MATMTMSSSQMDGTLTGTLTASLAVSTFNPYARPGSSLRKERLRDLGGRLEVDERRSAAATALLTLGSGRLLKSKRQQLPPLVSAPVAAWSCPGERAVEESLMGTSNMDSTAGTGGVMVETRAAPAPLDVAAKPHPLVSYRLSANQSLQTSPRTPYTAKESPTSSRALSELGKSPRRHTKLGRTTSRRRKAENLLHVETLQESFHFHIQILAGSGLGSFGVDELIAFLRNCELLDDWMTERKVRLFWTTFFESNQDADPRNITYEDFEGFLRWAADLKGMVWGRLAERVIMYFRANSDKSAAMMWRLEVVFETFAKTYAEEITPVEFAALCSACGLCQKPEFGIADVYLLFAEKDTTSVDFDGYMHMIGMAGKKLGIGNQAYRRIADAADTLDSEPFVLMRVRLALKQAASTVGGLDWHKMFYEVDTDEDGHMSFQEFRELVRNRLGLVNTSDWHLRMLYRKVDVHGQGRVSMNELIKIIAEGIDTRGGRRVSREAIASLNLARPRSSYS